MSLTSADIAHLVAELLDQYRYESVALAETYEQVTAGMRDRAEYGVVAESAVDVEWYDPNPNEFGLGQPSHCFAP